MARALREEIVIPTRPPIMQMQAQWERYVSNTASETTSRVYNRALQTFLGMFPDKGTPNDYSKADVLEFRQRRRRKVSASVVNYEVLVVRMFFKWLIDMEMASFNPAFGIQTLKQTEVLRTSFQTTEQERMYDACLDDRERLLVGLALTTGLRAATLHQLAKSNFDFTQRTIRIDGKMMKGRRVHELPIRAQELELVEALPAGHLWGKWARTAAALSYRWNLICRRAGLSTGMRLARRSAATTLIRAGTDVRMVQQWLGHKSILQTMKYMTPAETPELRKALATMPGDRHGEAPVVVQP